MPRRVYKFGSLDGPVSGLSMLTNLEVRVLKEEVHVTQQKTLEVGEYMTEAQAISECQADVDVYNSQPPQSTGLARLEVVETTRDIDAKVQDLENNGMGEEYPPNRSYYAQWNGQTVA